MENQPHQNLLDRMFEAFVKAIKESGCQEGTFKFNDREINFKQVDDKALDTLWLFDINGQRFCLFGSKADKMRLAASGLLGERLIDKGLRGLASIEDIEHRRRLARARANNQELWGPYAKKVWGFHDPAAHRPAVAKAAMSLIAFSVTDDGIPTSPRKARSMGVDMPFMSKPDWEAALRLARRLAELKDIKERLLAAKQASENPPDNNTPEQKA